jgi:hypothetical protein
MKKLTHTFVIVLLMLITMQQTYSQEYTFNDFVGTWHGTISSQLYSGYNDPITMTIESDGFYTETSGHLMPTIYPNTQQCEFEASTNRFHWWYLDVVYAGQYFYQHFLYEIVYFSNDTLEMHYNYWDDPEPWPEAGIIFIVRENLTPAPTGLEAELLGNNVALNWNEPSNGGGAIGDLLGYNIYHKEEYGVYELLDFVDNTYFAHQNITQGPHTYYITAVYNEGESDASNEVEVEFVISGIDDRVSDNTLLYPNPAHEFVNIRSEYKMTSIRIFNQNGQVISNEKLNSQNHQINLNEISSGLYLFVIEAGGDTISKRILVQ